MIGSPDVLICAMHIIHIECKLTYPHDQMNAWTNITAHVHVSCPWNYYDILINLDQYSDRTVMPYCGVTSNFSLGNKHS